MERRCTSRRRQSARRSPLASRASASSTATNQVRWTLSSTAMSRPCSTLPCPTLADSPPPSNDTPTLWASSTPSASGPRSPRRLLLLAWTVLPLLRRRTRKPGARRCCRPRKKRGDGGHATSSQPACCSPSASSCSTSSSKSTPATRTEAGARARMWRRGRRCVQDEAGRSKVEKREQHARENPSRAMAWTCARRAVARTQRCGAKRVSATFDCRAFRMRWRE
mmetsp:Transcript_43652/g.103146  ORF Transcript_43652/g.103146 Transcript_43652/m.103146 type:complete len:223 (+) Transcript_43652:485-1153(+)